MDGLVVAGIVTEPVGVGDVVHRDGQAVEDIIGVSGDDGFIGFGFNLRTIDLDGGNDIGVGIVGKFNAVILCVNGLDAPVDAVVTMFGSIEIVFDSEGNATGGIVFGASAGKPIRLWTRDQSCIIIMCKYLIINSLSWHCFPVLICLTFWVAFFIRVITKQNYFI